MTKIIVDKMPQKNEDCPFSYYNEHSGWLCKLQPLPPYYAKTCYYVSACPHLMTLKKVMESES